VSAIIYRKLDQNGDYTFGRRNAFFSETEAVAQAVKTRLLLFKGEWWENILDGTPFFQEIAGQFFSAADRAAQIDLVFSERITGTRGVAEITVFNSEINPHTRTYSASVTIRTIYDREFQISVTGAGGGLLSIEILKGGI